MFALTGLLTLALSLGSLPPTQQPHAQPVEPRSAAEPGQISFEVRFIETSDLNWRSAVSSQLQEVSRHGASTVWTMDDSVLGDLCQQLQGNVQATVIQAPPATTFEGVEAILTDLESQTLVTGIHWVPEGQ